MLIPRRQLLGGPGAERAIIRLDVVPTGGQALDREAVAVQLGAEGDVSKPEQAERAQVER